MRGEHPHRVTSAKESLSRRQARRRRIYFAMMGVCLLLFVASWSVVRLWSTPVAVAMALIAAVIPPVAAIIANWGES